MNFKKYVKAFLQKNKIWNPKIVLEEVSFLGHNLVTTSGAVRATGDKDDAWFYELAKHKNFILDIGCNNGFMGILAKIANPETALILIDPNPLALELAFKNLMLNKFTDNVNFMNAFVGEKPGEQIKFYAVASDASGSMYKGSAHSAAMVDSFFYVQSTTVDEICRKNNFTPDFIKVDVEGAENFVLNGSKNTAMNSKPLYLVEMHGPEELPMAKNAELVLKWCNEVSYSAYYMTTHQKITGPEEIAHRGRCHLLLLPHGVSYPEYLKQVGEGDHLK